MSDLITIQDTEIALGESKKVILHIAELPTGTAIHIPVYVFRGKEPGPNLLLQGGLHGDEINGIETLRRMLHLKLLNVRKGSVIVVPILNIFGFIHFSREVPDGKDINRCFPGTRKGSLAGRVAYRFMQDVFPWVDYGIDFHTGGGQRDNFPQVRYADGTEKAKEIAEVFAAPLTISSGLIKGTLRSVASKAGVPIVVFEGGEALRLDEQSIKIGIEGTQRVMHHLGMVDLEPPKIKIPSVHIDKGRWLRARSAGIFRSVIKNGNAIAKGELIGVLSDTYGKKEHKIKAPNDGVVYGINNMPVVNAGDALFHIGIKK